MVVALLVAGCGHEAGTTYITSGTLDASSTARVSAAERERDEAKRTAEEANLRASAERASREALAVELNTRREHDDFVNASWQRLGFLDAQIHALGTRAPRLSASRRAKLEREVTALKRSRESLNLAVRRLSDASDAEWRDARRAIEAQFDDADRLAVEAAWSSEP
jgi:hypothetical protein